MATRPPNPSNATGKIWFPQPHGTSQTNFQILERQILDPLFTVEVSSGRASKAVTRFGLDSLEMSTKPAIALSALKNTEIEDIC